MTHSDALRIVVAGTGPVGLVAALSLAGQGHAVTLVGPEEPGEDRRTTALMSPALEILDGLRLLEKLRDRAAPLKSMRIVDGTARLIRSQMVTFRAAEIGEEAFGLNMPNQALNGELRAAVAAHPGIDWRRTLVDSWTLGPENASAMLSDGTTVEAELVVAADGRSSPAREAARIDLAVTTYPQAALVLNFAHSREHGSVSTEFHTETGPLTQVPLPGNRSSLVWVVEPETAAELAAIDDAALSRKVEDRMQSMLGRVTVEPGRQVYPLSASLPSRFGEDRVVLVGEAAHVFPPIGAQGLNLGIRDVSDLTAIVVDLAPDAEAIVSAYDRKRRPDILARASAVKLLNRSLLSDMLPAQIARSAGLGAIAAFAPLRALFMREGLRPGSGFAGLFPSLRKEIRR